MRKFIVLLCFGLALSVLPYQVASAHFLSTDKQIGAILHISPDDSPSSGVPVTYYLSFDDTSGKFRLGNCDCMVSLIENGRNITTKPLTVTTTTYSSNTITFPDPAVYTMLISGKPKTAATFQPFSLSYAIRVTAGTDQAQSLPIMLWIGLGAGAGLLLLAAYAMQVSYTSNNKKDN